MCWPTVDRSVKICAELRWLEGWNMCWPTVVRREEEKCWPTVIRRVGICADLQWLKGCEYVLTTIEKGENMCWPKVVRRVGICADLQWLQGNCSVTGQCICNVLTYSGADVLGCRDHVEAGGCSQQHNCHVEDSHRSSQPWSKQNRNYTFSLKPRVQSTCKPLREFQPV